MRGGDVLAINFHQIFGFGFIVFVLINFVNIYVSKS